MAPSTTSSRPSIHRKSSSYNSRRSATVQRIEIIINVYDLLPPGRLASILWTIGGSLLHSGVAVAGREYAYGGHDQRGVTGVYWTKPKHEPPGGTWRRDVLQGFTFRSEEEIAQIIHEVSQEFQGRSYNLLTNNCNHFTSALCVRLTSKPAPAWLNRAASIGVALPCMVPREWVSPPDHDTADGELVDEEDEDEHSAMLRSDQRRHSKEERQTSSDNSAESSLAGGKRIVSRDDTPPPRPVSLTDTSGRKIPVAERAPMPKRT